MSNDPFRSKEGKVRFSISPMLGIDLVLKVGEFGAKKHGTLGYTQGFPISYWIDAAFRHIFIQWLLKKEDNDQESGLPHLAHGAWNILAALQQMLLKPELDDRSRQPVEEFMGQNKELMGDLRAQEELGRDGRVSVTRNCITCNEIYTYAVDDGDYHICTKHRSGAV